MDDELGILVVDNGVGVGQPDRLSGIANARARAELLGGHLDLTTPERRRDALRLARTVNRRGERPLLAPCPILGGWPLGPLAPLVVTFGPPGRGSSRVILRT